jgi:uncharacterized protein YdeI (YjbR/CyaY-like superfamily)
MEPPKPLSFATWSTWLERNHAVSDGIRILFYTKGSRRETLTYEEALEEALCWGWNLLEAAVHAAEEQEHLVQAQP